MIESTKKTRATKRVIAGTKYSSPTMIDSITEYAKNPHVKFTASHSCFFLYITHTWRLSTKPFPLSSHGIQSANINGTPQARVGVRYNNTNADGKR